MNPTRREWLWTASAAAAALAGGGASRVLGGDTSERGSGSVSPGAAPLRITGLKVTPVALPDPPILAASGCHGPYFLRNIVEIETDAGITGIGETRGGTARLKALEEAREHVVGQNAFATRRFADAVRRLDNAAWAGIELACLDACGQATGRRLCELLGGPVRDEAEFAAYLFYRYAADDPRLLDDPRIVDDRGRGEKALDAWGEVRTPGTMAEMAAQVRDRWGFRVFKLKGGVLEPGVELATMAALHERLGGDCPLRIDPNARWSVETAVRIGRELQRFPLEYYEDPVRGQRDMAEVRRRTGLVMSTNMCVTRFEHVPEAVETQPVDVVLGDHHGWGGIAAFQELGRICEIFGWGLSQHSNNHAGLTMAAMTHVGAVVPQLTIASDTHYVWLPEGTDLIEGPNIPIRGGAIEVPTGPGLGVALDRDKLARAHETWRKCGMRDRDDASTMQRVEPGWRRTTF